MLPLVPDRVPKLTKNQQGIITPTSFAFSTRKPWTNQRCYTTKNQNIISNWKAKTILRLQCLKYHTKASNTSMMLNHQRPKQNPKRPKNQQHTVAYIHASIRVRLRALLHSNLFQINSYRYSYHCGPYRADPSPRFTYYTYATVFHV